MLGNVCKHIVFAKKVGGQQGVNVLDICKIQSQLIIENGNCTLEQGYLAVQIDNGQVNIVHNGQCSSRANSLGETCVCLLVQLLLQESSKSERHWV